MADEWSTLAERAVFITVDQGTAEEGTAEGGRTVSADLIVPTHAQGVVIFAHGSGSSRRSPRNREVARALFDAPVASLLLDLLTGEEADFDERTRELRFDIELLTERLVHAIDWARGRHELKGLPLGLFGASTGASAALRAAAERPDAVAAVVSRGGRTDLADAVLPRVRAATLFIAGGADREILELNRRSLEKVGSERKQLAVIAGAGHLFSEEGALHQVADLTKRWFLETLVGGR